MVVPMGCRPFVRRALIADVDEPGLLALLGPGGLALLQVDWVRAVCVVAGGGGLPSCTLAFLRGSFPNSLEDGN